VMTGQLTLGTKKNNKIMIQSIIGSSFTGGGTSPNFDVTATNWNNWNVVDKSSFITFLESGGGGEKDGNSFTGISVTNFTFVNGRISCNLTTTSNGAFYLNSLGITNVLSLGNTTYTSLSIYGNNLSEFNVELSSSCISLDLSSNEIINFDPVILPNLTTIDLRNNLITEFNPSLPLPSTLTQLNLDSNLITEFDPDLPLPSSLGVLSIGSNNLTFFNPSQEWPNSVTTINLRENFITLAGYEASEPWANSLNVATPLSKAITTTLNPDSIVGTNLHTILLTKGFSFNI
jgi:hypothetical protein